MFSASTKENILFGISVVTFEASSCTNFQIFQDCAPDHVVGAYSAPPDPIAGGEGGSLPPHMESINVFIFRPSSKTV